MCVLCSLVLAGCVSPQYAIREPPVPDESSSALQIERAISVYQAKQFEADGTRRISPNERLWGFDIPSIVDRLSRVSERPYLQYQTYLWNLEDPNAAALADGRIYISKGMLNTLASRGSRADELAVIVAHELAHTAAQHLVKRYRMLQQQRWLLALVAAGTAAATRQSQAAQAQRTGRLVMDMAQLIQDVANSGYSQEQELEADQLGIGYVIRAGFDPRAALDLLQDFARFDSPWPFLRTHPYMRTRVDYLARYLQDRGLRAPASTSQPSSNQDVESRRKHLRQIQKLYPVGSVSWNNLQRQIEALDASIVTP